jgi:prohibitin 2
LKKSTAFIDIKRIEAAREIAQRLGKSHNRVYLDADSLLLNLTTGFDENLEKKLVNLRPAGNQ